MNFPNICSGIRSATTGFLPLLMGVVLMTFLSGCKIHKKASTGYTHRQELQIEQTEVEGKLKGHELMVLEEAFEWLDTPYAFGRDEKGKATDCSGLVMRVYEKTIGCKLPRVSAEQAEFCETITPHKVKPGDLVFFITNSGKKINHVGIMIDNQKFIHASTHGVMVSSMESDYYKKHFIKYGRVPCMKH